jgi:presenilin-like A22 family membrane protease
MLCKIKMCGLNTFPLLETILNPCNFIFQMKHSLKITLIMLGLFLVAQFVGLGILYNYIDTQATTETGVVTFSDLPLIERPQIEGTSSIFLIVFAVGLGTVLLLFLMKHNLSWIFRAWFFMAIFIALSIAFFAFFPIIFSVSLALIIALWRTIKSNFYVHTFSELFIYGGLAVIFAPLLSIIGVVILTIVIALYDAYAVWKSKHMITLAQSQTKAKVFSGLLIPYSFKNIQMSSSIKKKSSKKLSAKSTTKIPQKVRIAMLGGGDIGFPLIFAGVVMKEIGLWQSFIIPFFALAGLAYIMINGDEKKFYPAMPFIGAGCLVGLGAVMLIGLI